MRFAREEISLANRLKIVFLGGVEEIGKNMTLLEYGESAIILDAGLGFPNSENMPGVDFLIPDISYVKEIKKRIKGIFITHGHEDHIGALPFVLKDINVPVYGSSIALAFLDAKINRAGGNKKYKLVQIDNGSIIQAGDFSVEFIRTTHSIAGAFSLAITSPSGVIFFTGDFKIDHTPVDGKVADLSRIAAIGSKGVLLLMQDSTNVERLGYSMSESRVGKSLESVFNDNKTKRIIVATFASNIHRIKQIVDCALKQGRRIVLSGRSVLNTVAIAQKLGEIKLDPEMLIDINNTKKIPDDRICIIATGTQGEPSSALTRMSLDGFKNVSIGENDTVILSASPIPGNERSIHNVMNNLSKKGASLVYESLSEVHASGHACVEELKLMIALVKPTYFIPVHGEFRHLKKHAELAESMGIPRPNMFLPELGSCIEVSRGGIRILPSIDAGAVMLVGDIESDEGSIIERKKMAEDGIVISAITLSKTGKPKVEIDLTSKGLNILSAIEDEIQSTLQSRFSGGEYRNMVTEELSQLTRKIISKIFYSKQKRCPVIIPIIMFE